MTIAALRTTASSSGKNAGLNCRILAVKQIKVIDDDNAVKFVCSVRRHVLQMLVPLCLSQPFLSLTFCKSTKCAKTFSVLLFDSF